MVVDFEESAKKSYVCLQKFCISLDFTHFDVRGKLHSLWVKICWSWNSNNRNIVTGQAEFIAGDWITWWRFKFRLYAKKKLSNFIFKIFEKFRKIFSFSKIEKSENFRFCLLEIWDIEIWNIEIWEIFSENGKYSKSQNQKISDFSILENENFFWIFSKLLKIKFDNIFFAYRWNINLHHVIQSPAMNSARPVTIFRLFEFQLQQIFTHNPQIVEKSSVWRKLKQNQDFWRHNRDFFRYS